MAQLEELLGHIPFFAGLWDRGLEWVARTLVERRVPAGAEVFLEGESGHSLFVIKEGEVVALQGRAVLMRFGPGDFFGETTLLDLQPRPFTARVTRDAVLYELGTKALYELYKEDVKAYVLILQNLNRELCRRLRRVSERIVLEESSR